MKVAVARLSLVCACLIVMSLTWVGISDAGVRPQNMVALWVFDEGSGDTAGDSSGNGNDGELMEGTEWVNGVFGTALRFDGVDDYVEVAHSDSLDITEAITIVAWAKYEAIPDHEQLLLDKGPVGGGSQYYLAYQPNEDAYFLNFDGEIGWHAGDNFNSPPMTDTEWHHVVTTFDTTTGTIKVYLDGVCDEHTTDDVLASKDPDHLVIGAARFLQTNAAYYFNGIIDELAIFNVALTEDEINILAGGSMAAVAPAGKLATTWAQLKRL